MIWPICLIREAYGVYSYIDLFIFDLKKRITGSVEFVISVTQRFSSVNQRNPIYEALAQYEAAHVFARQSLLPEEDRQLYMPNAPWHGGYRWFRSPNVHCLEKYFASDAFAKCGWLLSNMMCFTAYGCLSKNGVDAAGKRGLVTGTRRTSLISSALDSPATHCGGDTGPTSPTYTNSWLISRRYHHVVVAPSSASAPSSIVVTAQFPHRAEITQKR
jgi:hypothetical protein